MLKFILSKLFSVPHYEAVQIKGHLYVIVKTERLFGFTFRETLPTWYSSAFVHHRVDFLNSLYEK